ncbi:MAG TPA: endonuclease/exonuclease/phosphatase family protein [Deltaproteobacteria bacterium]|nr:endonuclease/exonuclease/phosphatase family protein [Deltaproteobacteria bacterium]
MKINPGKLFSRVRKITVVPLLCIAVIMVMLAAPVSPAHAGKSEVNVMTRNLYLGADIFRVVVASQTDPSTIPYVVADVFQTMLYTNFWARAEAIADEVLESNPDVIGLQEVETFYIQTPGDFLVGNPQQATDAVIDFYEVLNSALQARGLEYRAFLVTNADVELPMINPDSPTFLSDVRMVDHDYILVKKGTPAWGVLSRNYALNLGLELSGSYVEFTRGYLVVGAFVKGKSYRFVNTHLEVRSSPESVFRVVQSAQMTELLGTLQFLSLFSPKTTVMMGDLNSSPDDVPGFGYHPEYEMWLPYVPPYKQAVCAGYLDTWLLQDEYDEGYTSGFGETIDNPDDTLTTRIDHIFLRPAFQRVLGVTSDVVGEEPGDMVPNLPYYPDVMLWPSDHAGVVSEITLRP